MRWRLSASARGRVRKRRGQRRIERIAAALGDQPHIKDEYLRMLLEFSFINKDCICQPSYNGKPVHPVILPLKIFRLINAFNGNTFKEFIRDSNVPIKLLEITEPSLLLDIDNKEDYNCLYSRF